MDTSSTTNLKSAKVYIADSVSGSFTYYQNLICESISIRTAPAISQAKLRFKYGKIAQSEIAAFEKVSALDLRGRVVAIYVQDSADVETIVMLGVIGSQTDNPYGTYQYSDTPTGNNYFSVFGLEYLLDRVPIDKTYVNPSIGSGFTKNIFAFNGSGGNLEKNRSASEGENGYYFDFSNSPQYWTAKDILEYLINNFATQTGYDISWYLFGDYDYLQYYTPNLDPKGKTLKQCLDEIIRPDFGFFYFVAGSTIYIYSISDSDISVDGTVIIPANSRTTSLSSEIQADRVISDVNITEVEQSAYSTIRVYSEPVRVMCTLKLGTDTGGMNIGWNTDLETSYNSATDKERQKESFSDVYSRYAISADWDKKDKAGNAVIPAVDETNLTVSFSEENIYVPGIYPITRNIPILKDSTSPKSGYKRPIVFAADEDETIHIIDKTNFEGDLNAPSISVNVLDDTPGIELHPPYPHILGKNHFSGSSDYSDYYDYEDAFATVSFYTDAILAYSIAGAALNNSVERTKNIYIPGLHYWVGIKDTYIDDDSQLSALTVYRDDREQIKKYAAIAKAWYGRTRNLLSFTTKYTRSLGYIGKVISSIYSGGSFTPVGTIVTALNYDFEGGQITINTDFMDVNLSRLNKRTYRSDSTNTNRRLAQIEDSIKNIPVRTSTGGGGGGSIVDIMLKTKVDYNTYTGDLYGNGLDQAATKTNITVRINIINSGETIAGLNTTAAVFPAWQKKWGPAESSVTYWTCQPEIYRGS